MRRAVCSELRDLQTWLVGALIPYAGTEHQAKLWVDSLGALPGDAGFRRYFGFSLPDAASFIAVISSPATEKNHEFVSIAKLFKANGVSVPEIYDCNLEQGFFLLQNLGKDAYRDHLNINSADSLYNVVVDELIKIQGISASSSNLLFYDSELIQRELTLFLEWFVCGLLNYNAGESELRMVQATFIQIENQVLEQPKVVVHRDFHSRNILFGEGGVPGIIDFQDAVIGPITYDVVSLFRDCYIQWPASKIQQWITAYQQKALKAGVVDHLDHRVFNRWFDWMGLQRHIKVLGIFSRLFLRDKKSRYLKDLPLVIFYVQQIAAQYQELQEFVQWFNQKLSPVIKQQNWMKEVEYV